MTAIIDFHPLRIVISIRMPRAAIAATPIEMDEIMVSASGGLYDGVIFEPNAGDFT